MKGKKSNGEITTLQVIYRICGKTSLLQILSLTIIVNSKSLWKTISIPIQVGQIKGIDQHNSRKISIQIVIVGMQASHEAPLERSELSTKFMPKVCDYPHNEQPIRHKT